MPDSLPSPLPRATDVLVIGGGIAGCACAYYLAGGGAEVVLIERHDVNTLASGSNAGSIHAQIPQHEFLKYGDGWARAFASTIPLLLDSIALWESLETELGTDLELSLAGGVMVARTEAQLRDVARKARIERQHGLAVEMLGRADLREVAPYVGDDAIGGTLCRREGKANPLSVAPAFARRAEARGAIIRRRTELLGLERAGQGFAGHGFVATTSAGRIAARRVVNCAGADAARIAAMVGVQLGLEGFPIQVNVTTPVAPLVPHLVYYAGGQLSLKQAHNGRFLIGGGWPARRDAMTLRPVIAPESVIGNLLLATAVVPAVADASLLRSWAAVVNGTPDWRPILGEMPGVAGFFLCCFPWIGFTAGPIAARIIADLVLGRRVSRALTDVFQ